MFEALPIEAVAAQPASPSDPTIKGDLNVDLSTGPVQKPSTAEASDFVNLANSVLQEVRSLPPSTDGLSDRLVKQLEELSSHFKLPQHPEPSADPIADSLKTMERAYIFAIEATMASRGSTEATKIFNTLLKGQ